MRIDLERQGPESPAEIKGMGIITFTYRGDVQILWLWKGLCKMRRWEMVWFLGARGDGPPDAGSCIVQQFVQNYPDALKACSDV